MAGWDFFYKGVDLENAEEGDSRRRPSREKSSPPTRVAEFQPERQVAESFRYAPEEPFREERRRMERKAPYNPPSPPPEPLSYGRRATSLSEVLVYSPRGYEDVQGLIDYLKNGVPIIVDLNAVRDNAAQRILDFLSGAIYALDGAVLKLQGSMFLLTPSGVSIAN